MRILTVDDHALFRAGLTSFLEDIYPGVELVQADTLAGGMRKAREERLNVVFLDLELPDGHGFTALAELKDVRPSLPVIVASADERAETVTRCIELRAMGYVPKSAPPDALRAALDAVLAGGVFLPAASVDHLRRGMVKPAGPSLTSQNATPHPPAARISTASDLRLSPREFETLAWLSRGLPTKTIAVRMGLEDITVRKYVSSLLAHFNVRRRTELIVALADSGVRLGPPPTLDPASDGSRRQ